MLKITDATRGRLGTALVALQFALIAALAAYGAPEFLSGQAPAIAWALAAGGAVLGAWALYCNRPGNFNIRPIPRVGGHLVQQGPYRWIRHPMYTAVILCGLACAWVLGSATGWLAWAALVTVLAVKATLEERWMLDQHPDYAAYRTRTWRFVPGLF
jgi:protein-S-isoprenylcysteine O-methyltransferase Ste14